MPGERFHVRLLPEEGGGPGERVVAEVGLEGFNILDTSGARNLRKYPLHHISRWSMRGSSLILFTRSPVRPPTGVGECSRASRTAADKRRVPPAARGAGRRAAGSGGGRGRSCGLANAKFPLLTPSQVDVEDRSVTLQGDETTIRSVLDTLTCSCMQ